jgi:hypothetical protein
MASKKTTIEHINSALKSWERLPVDVAKKQRHFKMAQDLSAVRQCINFGILNERGEISERTAKLIREYHRTCQ